MNVTSRSPQEIQEAFHNQMAALQASCAGYDKGNFWEGPRIATVLYILVNDGAKKSKSILSQMGVRNNISFVSTLPPVHPLSLLKSGAPLCATRIKYDPEGESFARYEARLRENHNGIREINFNQWWREEIYTNVQKAGLSRMNLTFALRSKDGGSHFDETIPNSPYLDLKEQRGEAMQFAANGEVKKISNAHVATMRQIAWELFETIKINSLGNFDDPGEQTG